MFRLRLRDKSCSQSCVACRRDGGRTAARQSRWRLFQDTEEHKKKRRSALLWGLRVMLDDRDAL
jgi:wyosine [tRNA(Phe)-imidazoG37] synthetase (radical SAM superfamily)